MTIKVWSWRSLIEQAALPPMTKLVLYTLANHMNEHGKGAFPSILTIGAACGLKERAVYKHIAIAERNGFLKRDKLGKGGKQWASNAYEASYPQGMHSDAGLHEGASQRSENGMHEGAALHHGAVMGCTTVQPNSPVELSKEVVEDSAREADLAATAKTMTIKIRNLLNAPHFYDYQPVLAWLLNGADYELDILPVIEKHVQSGLSPPRSKLSYFDGHIADSIRLRRKKLNTEQANGPSIIEPDRNHSGRPSRALSFAENFAIAASDILADRR